MIQTANTANDLVIQKNTGEKNKQVILIILHNPGDTQADGTITVNGTQIFGNSIAQGENVMFSTEKILLETDGDQISITGQINKVVSYARY